MCLHSSLPLIGEAYGEEESQVSSHVDRCQGQARQLRPRRITGVSSESLHGSGDTRTFLRARFGLTEDVLLPYKRTIEQWLYPDVFGKEDISVSKATKAISDYKKAVDQPEGLTESMVFYAKWRLIFAMSSGCKMRGTSVPSCGCLSKPPSWQTPYHPLAGWVCGAP
jgi:hypothetical protein